MVHFKINTQTSFRRRKTFSHKELQNDKWYDRNTRGPQHVRNGAIFVPLTVEFLRVLPCINEHLVSFRIEIASLCMRGMKLKQQLYIPVKVTLDIYGAQLNVNGAFGNIQGNLAAPNICVVGYLCWTDLLSGVIKQIPGVIRPRSFDVYKKYHFPDEKYKQLSALYGWIMWNIKTWDLKNRATRAI